MGAIFVGGFVALCISWFAAGQLGIAIEGTNEGPVGSVVFLALMSLLLTAAVGAAQGWLLKQYLPIAHWFGATLAGGAIGAVITGGVGLSGDFSLDLPSAATWAGTAIAQWFLLRRFSARSIVWLIAGVVQILLVLNQPNLMILNPPIIILIYSIVTAILIVWILRGSSRSIKLTDPQV
ncbi:MULTISPECIES: hypothetical protein [Cyanophyceae]|uniref:hypothetical protein n=1 Tax=Cyanophyceae TaxID=3028117 RepID=UPI001683B546|nr:MULTISPECIES: hypothetical protein [Cyanophyceae]MBD1915876.1 hypothetical protein [Phormidium sp. FACHB-77]MBD2030450.1 hypothetical protein [Phormidium sp. FACHB-322]MBD2053452.1 hypothetical protein [Leptolyngbya sp. FACHB-60]